MIYIDATEEEARPLRDLLDELVSDETVERVYEEDLDAWLDIAGDMLDLARRHLAAVSGNPDPAEAAYHMRVYLVANAIGQTALAFAAVWQAYEEETFGIDAEQWADDAPAD